MRQDEHVLQSTCVRWFRYVYDDCMIFAIPNGGRRDNTTGARLKIEGVLAGVADLVVLAQNRRAFFIEMKTQKGYQSAAQKEFQVRVTQMQFGYHVCHSFDEFRTVCENELGAR